MGVKDSEIYSKDGRRNVGQFFSFARAGYMIIFYD